MHFCDITHILHHRSTNFCFMVIFHAFFTLILLKLPYLTNRSSTKCGNWCDGKMQYTNDQHCDKISVNNVNLVIQQQIASGKHFRISLTNVPLNVKIGIMIKSNTPMINVVIRSL